MTIGDGIAVAGCAWAAAYLCRWYVHGYRMARIAKVLAEGTDKIVAAVKSK